MSAIHKTQKGTHMILLNYRDSSPIYEQIKEGLKKLVITGAYEKDQKLPSVRELAAELAINPNTISKAFKELEAEGYIYTIAGKGSFAAEQGDVDPNRVKKLYATFDETVKELLYLSKSEEELFERIRKLADEQTS